jgi:hypothetical protein
MALFDYYKKIKEKMRVEHLFGAQHIAGSHSVSCVIWVPSEDEIGGVEPRSKQPKSVFNRAAGADIYIFGVDNLKKEDKDANHIATEDLLHEVLVCLHDNCESNLSFDRVRWGLRQQDQWLTFGGACVLPVYFDVPVCAKPLRTAKLKDMEPIDNEFSQEIQ